MAEALGLAFIRKEVQLQDNLIGTGFAEAPQSGKTRVNYTGEIVQAVWKDIFYFLFQPYLLNIFYYTVLLI